MDSMDHTLHMFMGIYGVGYAKAVKLVMQGFRTLQEVMAKGDLTKAQRIGVELYQVHYLIPLLTNRILHNEFQERKSAFIQKL